MNCRVAEADCAVPGRGLEPLRITPPDPKSGASANSATLAERRIDLARILPQSLNLEWPILHALLHARLTPGEMHG